MNIVDWDSKGPALAQIARLSIALDMNREQRDAAISFARLHGATLTEIAKAAGMTKQGVSKLLLKKAGQEG